MIQNIQKLLNELISYTLVDTSSISFEAKGIILLKMREEFQKLELSDDPNKQSKMISLFMGGTIYALDTDDHKYAEIYQFKLNPGTIAQDVLNKLKKGSTQLEAMYAIGNEALLNLPQAFNGELFKIEGKLVNSTGPIPFFPDLKINADKVDLLVKFCIKYSQDLERSEVDTDDLVSISLKTEESRPEVDNRMSISMQVLGGFIAVVGCAAVATAFILLNAATFGTAGLVVAGLGVAAVLSGVGLFTTGTYKNRQATPDEPLEYAVALANP